MAAYSRPDTYVVLKEDQPRQYIKPKEGVSHLGRGLLSSCSETENYHHAHEYADAWASLSTWASASSARGASHVNTGVDLTIRSTPTWSRSSGSTTSRPPLSSGIFDAYQPQRAEYNRAWDEVKAAAG